MRTFSCGVIGVGLEKFQHAGNEVDAAPPGLDEPGLVVDAGGGDIHIAAWSFSSAFSSPFALCPVLDAARDLAVGALHAMAQSHVLTLPYFWQAHVFMPWVRVIEEEGTGFGDLADVLAEIEQGGNGALGVHDPARAEGIARRTDRCRT